MEIFGFSFFWKALFVGLFFSLISGFFGSLIVLRREVQIGHAISNASLLGVVLGFCFGVNIELSSIFTSIFLSIILFFLLKFKKITGDSIIEFLSQFFLAFAMFLLGFLSFMRVDINSFLFGSILGTTNLDLFVIAILSVLSCILGYFFYKKMVALSVNADLAKLSGFKISVLEIFYYIFLALIIALGIKIFGILLISAFLIIPANISKLISKNLDFYVINSIIFASIGTILGIFLSFFINSPTGPTIVLTLAFIFIFYYLLKIIKK